MDDLSPSDLIHQERLAVQKELEWLLKHEVPAVYMQLGVMLMDCYHLLLGSSSASSASSSLPSSSSTLSASSSASVAAAASLTSSGAASANINAPMSALGAVGALGNPQQPPLSSSNPPTNAQISSAITLPITTASDSLKGYVTLDGFRIIKAELTVRFAKWNKSAQVQVNIAPKEPWFLSQIQNAANYIQLAFAEIDDSSLQHGLFHTKEQVYSVMDRVMSFLRKAKDHLVFSQSQFPFNIDELQMMCLSPKPPSDLFVDFSINYASLCVSVYVVTFLNVNQAPRKVSSSARKKSDMLIGCVHETSSGARLEVIDHDEVECQIPAIVKALTAIKSAHELCQRMKDKVVALVV